MNNTHALSWKVEAVRRLGEPQAPRVLDREDLKVWLESQGITPPKRTLLRALQEWESAQLLVRIARGFYINRQATPLPLPEEAAQRLRPGAVISLATVLGRAGVLNNPTHWVTAVLPTSSVKGVADVSGPNETMFRFAYLRDDLVSNDSPEWMSDTRAPYAQVPTATPEKALMDWIYLTTSPRGAARWPMPPAHDWDLSYLDAERLDRLASRMGLGESLRQFRQALASEVPRVSIRRGLKR